MKGRVRSYFTYESFSYDYILSRVRGQPYACVVLPQYVRSKAGTISPDIGTTKQDKAWTGHNWWELLYTESCHSVGTLLNGKYLYKQCI